MKEISILGKNIKRIRELKNIPRTKLSIISKVGTTTLYDIEHGNSQSLGTINLEKVAKALNVNTSELLNEQEIKIKDIDDILVFIKGNEFIADNKTLTDYERYILMHSLDSAINIINYGRNKGKKNKDK